MRKNIKHFPKDFMFQQTKEEVETLKCQNGTSSWGGDRKA
ncbi:ORF6N domain-containing protein [Leyella stercorea]|nr:ORF6N domain-containing protein [Leyella stercorea]